MSKTTTEKIPSLDTKSLTIQNPPSTYREYLSTDYIKSEMTAVRDLYEELNADLKAIRLDDCRSQAYFVRNVETGIVQVLSKSCHVRFCPLCSRAKSLRIKHNTANWLKSCRHAKFVTLTLRHSNESLEDSIERLYSCFKELRRLKLWKKKVFGGIWFTEIKFSTAGQWHPHIHIVIDGFYVSQSKLSKEWERLTTDSPIVDIRSVKDPEKVAEYVAKYATKPSNLKCLKMPQRIELYDALKKRRLIGTFGSAFKAKITKKPEYDPTEFKKIGSWGAVTGLYDYHPDATIIWNSFRNHLPIDQEIDCTNIDDFIRGSPGPNEWKANPTKKELMLWSNAS